MSELSCNTKVSTGLWSLSLFCLLTNQLEVVGHQRSLNNRNSRESRNLIHHVAMRGMNILGSLYGSLQ